jgi:hypothetical protein
MLMASTLPNPHGVRVPLGGRTQRKIRSDREAIDLIGEACEQRANLPVERLGETFSHSRPAPSSWKFLQYGLRLAVVGDVSRYVVRHGQHFTASPSLIPPRRN